MRVFFAFPGQGTQRPGILHGLNTFGLSVLEEMSNAIGLDLLTLDSAEAFERTENVQLALLCAGIGKCRELEAAGIQPSLVAGLSIGAFGAAVAAHALSLTRCCSFGATSRPLDAGCLSFGIWHDGNRRIEPQYSGRHNECR